MKKYLLFVILSVALGGQVFAQSYGDRLSFGQGNFFLNNSYISFQQAREIVSVNEEASQYLKKARANRTWANVLSYPGYFVAGWGIGGLLGGLPFSETGPYLGAGLVLIGGSLLLDMGFSKNAELGVQVYNSSQFSGANRSDVKLHAGLTSSGVGLRLSF